MQPKPMPQQLQVELREPESEGIYANLAIISHSPFPALAMGDIAFNLLIFFVILARAQDDSHLEWKPASASELENAGASKVSVLIDADNKYYVNGQNLGSEQLAAEIEAKLGDAPQELCGLSTSGLARQSFQ